MESIGAKKFEFIQFVLIQIYWCEEQIEGHSFHLLLKLTPLEKEGVLHDWCSWWFSDDIKWWWPWWCFCCHMCHLNIGYDGDRKDHPLLWFELSFTFPNALKAFYGKWSRPQRKCQDLKRSWQLGKDLRLFWQLEKDPRCFLWHLPNYQLHMPLTCAALNKMVRESAGGENLALKKSFKNWRWKLKQLKFTGGEEYHPNRPQDFIQKVTLAWEPH